MKEMKLKGQKVEIGNYTYKLQKEAVTAIKAKKSSEMDCAIKYEMYKLLQNSKGIDHYTPYEDFEKIYNKSKKSSKDTLKKYSVDLVKEQILNALSVYLNYCNNKQKAYVFRSSYEPLKRITFEFTSKDKIRILEVDDLESLEKYNKIFDIIPDNEFPFFVFIDKCMDIQYYPENDNIFSWCRYKSADMGTAVNLIYEHRGRKYIL